MKTPPTTPLRGVIGLPDLAAMKATGKILHGLGHLGARLRDVSAAEIRWDGSDECTTHKIYLSNASANMGRPVFAHLEVVVTGRRVRRQAVVSLADGHRYMVTGTKCRFRFTGTDSTRTWQDGVLVG